MDRRDFFLSAAKASGLVLPWWGMIPIANAQSYSGKIFIDIHLDGGIDQSSWTDPSDDPTINNYAAAGTPIVAAGNLRVAPMGNNAAFFNMYRDQILICNGVNTQTNSHEDGDRCSATGTLMAGRATMNELFAGTHGGGMAMAWLNQGGGFAMSSGTATPTPIPSGDQLRASVLPNASGGDTDFLKQADVDKVLATRFARVEALKANGVSLPREAKINDQYLAAKEARVRLSQVAALIPAQFDQQTNAHVALLAAQAGITSTAMLRTGGFDGHGQLANSYNGANGSLTRATNLADYIWTKAATMGLTSRIVVLLRSEFGRTVLNGGNGKDHWNPGGTMVWMFPPGSGLGNRVVGATDARHRSLAMNMSNGRPDPMGTVWTPGHVFESARKYLAIQIGNPLNELNIPAAERIDLFNPAISTGYPSLT